MSFKTTGLMLALALGLLAAPLVAEAQQTPEKVPRIGFLRWTSIPPGDPVVEAFRQGLRDLGYVEGRTIVVEYRSAEGQSDRAAAHAAELLSGAEMTCDRSVDRGARA